MPIITGDDDMKKWFGFLLAGILALSTAGCAEKAPVFAFPAEEGFILTVEKTDKGGGRIVLDCRLENRTGQDYMIAYGPEAIAYMMDGVQEISAEDNVHYLLYREDADIKRRIELSITEPGTHQVVVTAEIAALPRINYEEKPYMDFTDYDQKNTRSYSYSQDFIFDIEE